MRKFIFLLLFLFVSSPVFATTLGLKSGKNVTGEIVEFGDGFFKLKDASGVVTTYSFEDVVTFDGKRPEDFDTDKSGCVLYSRQTGQKDYEQGEEVIFCPDSIRYIHEPYHFILVLPIYWDKVSMSDRKVGVTSIAFSPVSDARVFIRIELKKGVRNPLKESLSKKIKNIKETLSDFKFVLEPENVVREDEEEVKFSYRTRQYAFSETHLIKDGNFLYDVSLLCFRVEDYDRFIGDFNNILKSIGFGTTAENIKELESGKVKFRFAK